MCEDYKQKENIKYHQRNKMDIKKEEKNCHCKKTRDES
jgi:hypothetical protein